MATCISLDKFIPRGFYCYKILNVEVTDNKKPFDGGVIIHTKPCMFYQHKKESCWLMGGAEIDDQCKICGINKFTERN